MGKGQKGKSMKLFRIYTENKNYESIIKPILETAFDGFTVFRGSGNWKGNNEESLLIEIYTENIGFIHSVADKIGKYNSQENVLVTETDCKVEFR
jgi:hypothetical protein